jgi:hypothetical protein
MGGFQKEGSSTAECVTSDAVNSRLAESNSLQLANDQIPDSQWSGVGKYFRALLLGTD